MARPSRETYQAIYQNRYIDAATGDSIEELIRNHSLSLNNFINSIPDEKTNYRYAPEKWTVKQLLQHMIDTERIFSYRALRFSRNDIAPLPGFDEDSYALNAPVEHRSLSSLKEEFIATRKSTDILLTSFTEEQLQMIGIASGYKVSVNALCFIIFGHNLHHQKILQERYLFSG